MINEVLTAKGKSVVKGGSNFLAATVMSSSLVCHLQEFLIPFLLQCFVCYQTRGLMLRDVNERGHPRAINPAVLLMEELQFS